MIVADLEWYDIVVRLALAAVLGAVVGIERETAGQDAGFRTHLMLALGAALFGVISVGAFDEFMTSGRTNVRVDVTRIASYVAAGIGFIGGGVIVKHAGSVRGITTAASLWTAAAIGLAAGVGFWVGAVAATAIALLALSLLKPLSNWIDRRSNPPRSLVVVLTQAQLGARVFTAIQEAAPTAVKSMQLGRGDDDTSTELAVQFWTRPDDALMEQIIDRLDEFGSDVQSISFQS